MWRALSSCACRGPSRASARGLPSCCANPASRWSSVSSVLCPFLPTPSFRHAKEMELQRARRRRDELGHQPLCDRIRRRVLRKTHADARGRDVTTYRARVNTERRRRFCERSLQHVAQHEGAEVRPAQRVPADEVAEARTEEPSSRTRSSAEPSSSGRRASRCSVLRCRASRWCAWRCHASPSCVGPSRASPSSSVGLRSSRHGAASSCDRRRWTMSRSSARAEVAWGSLAAVSAIPSRAPSVRTNRCLGLPAWFLPKIGGTFA